LANKVEAIHAKGLLPSQWDRKDLGIMVRWFKRAWDKALPSTKEQLLHRYYQTCSRCKQEQSRLKEGENSVLDDDASTGNPSDGTPGVSGSGSGNPSNGTPNLSSSGSGSDNPSISTLGVSGSGSGSGNPSNGTPNLNDSGSGSGNPMNSTVTYDLLVVEAAEAIGLLVSQRWAAGRNSASKN
jgi:flagellar hook-length control protein FliK